MVPRVNWLARLGARPRTLLAVLLIALTHISLTHIPLTHIAIAPTTFAQPISTLDPSVPVDYNTDPRLDGVLRVLRVDLGLSGSIGVDRFGMITAWITSGPKPWSGTLAVSYPDSNGTEVNNYVAAATTPNRVTPVEIVVRLPSRVQNVTISDAATGRVRATLAQIPAQRELPLAIEFSGSALVATLGDVSLARMTVDRVGMTIDRDALTPVNPATRVTPRPGTPVDFWPSVKVAPIRRLPQAWIAYDQADVVIATSTALEAMGQRGRDPLLTWVRSGGHLVVISDSSSREWALAGCAEAIDLETIASVDAPATLRNAVTQSRSTAPISEYQIRTRPLRVLDPAWRPLWPIDASSQLSLGAAGPVGMGFVTVFGGDPGRWVPVASTDNSIAIWRQIVQPSVEDRADTDQYAWMSGARARSEAATRRWMLDRAFAAPLPNPTLLSVLLLVLVISLALVLGPVDMLLLRRLGLRHRSHRSAMAWLAAASLLAYLIPLFIRSSDDTLARGATTDIVLTHDGQTLHATTGSTLVYAGAGANVQLDGLPDGTWCTVAGIEANSYSGNPNMILPPFNVAQTSTAEGLRQGLIPALTVGQWTFRIIEDLQPAQSAGQHAPLRSARVQRVGGEWRVTIEGLFPNQNASIEQCTLSILNAPMGVRLTQEAPGRWVGYANSASAPVGPETTSYDAYARSRRNQTLYRVDLPLTSQRTRAFNAYANAPGWSVITLAVTRDESDVRVPRFAPRTLSVIRIAVPTPEASNAEPAPATPGNTGPNSEHANDQSTDTSEDGE